MILLYFKLFNMQNINKIKELLNKGESPNISIIDCITPLHLAVNKKNERIIEYLLKNNADTNSKNIIGGQTPVHYAVINNSNKKILSLLIKYGGLFNIKDNNNKTAFEYIKDISIYSYIKRLLNCNEYRNNTNIQNSNNIYSLISELSEKNTENDIIINNNTIYSESSTKKETLYKRNMTNNIKKDLLNSFEKDLEIFNEQNNNNRNKENINPNYKQDKEKQTIINIEEENKKPITNKYRKIINRTKKRTNNSPLS